jgi:hypothetical protein
MQPCQNNSNKGKLNRAFPNLTFLELNKSQSTFYNSIYKKYRC